MSNVFGTKSLQQQADEAMVRQVQAEAPSQFKVGATVDVLTRRADVTATYDRRWRNGLGLTAYLRAWWEDKAVLPADEQGAVIGVTVVQKF